MPQVAEVATAGGRPLSPDRPDRPGLKEAVAAAAGRPVTIRIGGTLLLLGLLALAGLPGGHRDFTSDQSLRITSPPPLATVSVPFTVSWKAPAGHRYAVFVDSVPISVGGSLHELGGAECRVDPTCQPPAASLESIGVYVSHTGHVQVTNLPILTNLGSHQRYPVHQITIIPLDDVGHRVGTAVWQTEVHGAKFNG